jgi:hypothetical protein
MEAKNDLILEQINEFVDQNSTNLTRVRKENPDLFSVVSDTLSFLRKRYGGEEIDISQLIKLEEEPESELPNLEVGDMFSSPQALDQIYTINSITNNDVVVYIDNIDTGKRVYDWDTTVDYLQEQIKSGNLVKIEQKKETSSYSFKEGDLFFIVGFPNDVYVITDISQGKINYKRITRKNALTETMKIDDFKGIIDSKDVYFLPKANELTFAVGDLLINQIGDVSRVDNIDVNTNSVILVSDGGASTRTMYLTDIVDRIDEGRLTVQKVGSFQSIPASQPSSYSFKEGDNLYYVANPKIIYTIQSITNYGDVEVTENDGTEWTWDADTLEEEIEDGLLMVGMPPVAGQAPAQTTLEQQINELKDAIEGFQILADIGDDDAIEEIKKLKKELKTLKASNK